MTEISISNKKIKLTVGEKSVITPILSPKNASDKTVSYISSQPNVVEVNKKGEIIAKQIGKVKLTIKSKACPNVRKTCWVYVTEKEIEPTPEPIPEPTPEPTLEPTTEPTPEPAPEPAPESTSIIVGNAQELKAAIDNIATQLNNNKANINNQYDIYLKPGEYDTYSIMDKEKMINGDEPFYRSLEIPDGVNLHGLGNVTLTCEVPESDNSISKNMSVIVSTINIYGNNTIENMKIIAKNCRYCVHDDYGGRDYSSEYSQVVFNNVEFIHEGMSSNLYFKTPRCYGAGYKRGRKGYFNNCIFRNDYNPCLYIHSHLFLDDADKCYATINNCVFYSQYEYPIDFQIPWENSCGGDFTVNNSVFIGGKGILLEGIMPCNLFGSGNSSGLKIANLNNSNLYIVAEDAEIINSLEAEDNKKGVSGNDICENELR